MESQKVELQNNLAGTLQEDSSSVKHWVETLFPPTYGLPVAEIEKVCPQTESPKEDKIDIFDEYARAKISPDDVTSIKNVYERVWLMVWIEEEEKRKQEKAEKEGKEIKHSRTEKDKIKPSATISNGLQAPAIVTEQSVEREDKTLKSDLDNSSIWTSKEIEILREVFKKAKTQNAELKGTLQATEERVTVAEEKLKKQNRTVETQHKSLQENQKANKRQKIMCDYLKQELDKANAKIALLHKQLKIEKQIQSKANKEIHHLRLELDKERIDRKRAEIQLRNTHQMALQEFIVKEENLKTSHQDDIEFLQTEILKVNEYLQKEKDDHERSKRGLEHLRKHFSSLPLHEEVKVNSVGPVNQDQITKWTY